MPSRLYRHIHAWRRRLSRSAIAARLLRRERRTSERPEHGLLLLQIDGLGREAFEHALRRGRMPFLRRLLRHGGYELRDFYSGLPSSTPAVQGEILFGVRTAVPSFAFYDRDACVERRMFHSQSARHVAERLANASDEPLLLGGGSYSNIYAAGAASARFCGERLDLPSLFQGVSLWRILSLFVLYLPKFLRIAALGIVEVVVATVDCVRGIVAHQDLGKELLFVPTRLAVCIVLRELVEFMVRLDIHEGSPVVLANFLGYDEQSHRRGPDSRFAHWTLLGIDRAVRDITRAAARSRARDYEVIVFSDHGQERTRPLQDITGTSLADAVRETLSHLGADTGQRAESAHRNEITRARGRSLLRRGPEPAEAPLDPEDVVITALGPVGHIYHPALQREADLREAAAGRLAREFGIPLVLYTTDDGNLRGVTAEETVDLPGEGGRLTGPDHPFGNEVVGDLVDLCRHRDAGDLVVCGWRASVPPLTFSIENGAHGGFGKRETHGFVLAPNGFLPASANPKARVRGEDLYHSARRFLGRSGIQDHPPHHEAHGEQDRATSQLQLRVMTYNIHSCLGMDGHLRPDRIARVIKAAAPDIVALQEVDVRRKRSGSEHQAEVLANHLGMRHHFFSLLSHEHGEEYGLALLSRFPFEIVKEGHLTAGVPHRKREARGAIWARIALPDGTALHCVNTHFGLAAAERLAQAETLLGADWLRDVAANEPLVVCGDFNSSPKSRAYRRLCATLSDAQRATDPPTAYRTFSSTKPLFRIDHILVNSLIAVDHVLRPLTPRAILASDHLPLSADLRCARSPSHAETEPHPQSHARPL